MTQEQIIEGNKAIDKFIGNDHSYMKENFYWLNDMNYHEDWNLLMPVVEKIEDIKDTHHGHFVVYIGSNECTIQATNLRTDKPLTDPPHYFDDVTLDTKKISTWYAVIRFIQWYNTQKQTP